MEADADADADATAPAGLGLPPRPISPPRLDSDAPPHGAHGEAEGGGIGQDAVHRQVGFYLGGAGRQVLGDDRDGDVQRAGVDAALGEADSSRISQDDVPALPVAQRQVGFYLGDAVDRQVLGNGQDGEVPDAARFAAVPPGGDPAGDDVDLQGIEVGGDGIMPDALPPVGRGGNGIVAANQGLGVGRAALPPRGRGRGVEHPGVALPPRGHGRGRGGDHHANVVDLYGPNPNRPDAKGRTIPRLGRKFESEDERTTLMNYQLQTLYLQLQDRKADAREADETSGRKAALSIVKHYEKGWTKAERLRRQIARAGAIPVDKPKDLSKDPLA